MAKNQKYMRSSSSQISDRLERTTVRNRGEDRRIPSVPYGYEYQDYNTETPLPQQERAIYRDEIRSRYANMYRIEQERDQRAFNSTTRLDDEFWAGVDPRRRKEVADAGMIREDHNAMANLSPRAIHHEWPQAPFYQSPYIDDTVRGAGELDTDDGY